MSEEPATLISAGLAELLAENPIVPGRITPQKVYDGDGVRMRHIAMDANTVLREHTVPHPIIVTVAAGRVRFLVGEVTHTLTSGGMVHVRAGQPHEVQADEPSHLLITLIG